MTRWAIHLCLSVWCKICRQFQIAHVVTTTCLIMQMVLPVVTREKGSQPPQPTRSKSSDYDKTSLTVLKWRGRPLKIINCNKIKCSSNSSNSSSSLEIKLIRTNKTTTGKCCRRGQLGRVPRHSRSPWLLSHLSNSSHSRWWVVRRQVSTNLLAADKKMSRWSSTTRLKGPSVLALS